MSFLKLTGKFFFRLKTDHFHFLVRFRKTHGTGGGANVDGPGENFNIGNLAENEMAYCQHIQKSMKKFSATFPMLKFSRQTPTLRWFFSRDSQEGLNFILFRHFRHIGVVGGVQKQIGIKFQWVTTISSKNGGCGTSQGPTIIFSEKKIRASKSCDTESYTNFEHCIVFSCHHVN